MNEFRGGDCFIRGVQYSVRAELTLTSGVWGLGDYGVRLSRKERLPIGKDAHELIGNELIKAWSKFIGFNPSLPHMAQRAYIANSLDSAIQRRDEALAEAAKAAEEVKSLSSQFKDAHDLVYATVNEVQKELLDTGFKD
jgi:hypothetical protein